MFTFYSNTFRPCATHATIITSYDNDNNVFDDNEDYDATIPFQEEIMNGIIPRLEAVPLIYLEEETPIYFPMQCQVKEWFLGDKLLHT